MDRREALKWLTGLVTGMFGAKAAESATVQALPLDYQSLYVLTLGHDYDADDEAVARIYAKWHERFVGPPKYPEPKLVVVPPGCNLERLGPPKATPYHFREELGDYTYEVSFATLDEMNTWLKVHGPNPRKEL